MFPFHFKKIDAESLIKMQIGWKQGRVPILGKKSLFENYVDDSQPTVYAITVTILSEISASCLVNLRMKLWIVV